MAIAHRTAAPSQRDRLLKLVSQYHKANQANEALPDDVQQELEALVMSELHMPLARAKVVLQHLALPSEDDAPKDTEELEGEAMDDELFEGGAEDEDDKER